MRGTTDRGGRVGQNGVDENDLIERCLKTATHSVCWTSLERMRERLETKSGMSPASIEALTDQPISPTLWVYTRVYDALIDVLFLIITNDVSVAFLRTLFARAGCQRPESRPNNATDYNKT